jgi:hypothetical protein
MAVSGFNLPINGYNTREGESRAGSIGPARR